MPQKNNKAASRWARASTIVVHTAIATSILAGGASLSGWILKIPTLITVLPGLAAMKANTALALILAGVSLWLLRQESASSRARLAARIIALIVGALGLATLAEYALGVNLDIDQIFLADTMSADAYPGRMAPATAVEFLLLSLALLFIDAETRRGRRPAQYLALAAVVLSLLALIGYAYEVGLLDASPYASVALHTALALAVLGAGILSARPNRGWMTLIASEGAGGLTARRILPAVAIIPLVLGWLMVNGEDAGLYDIHFGAALLITATIVLLAAVIWLNALTIDRIEAERKRREEELRLLKAAVEAAANGIMITDRDGQITWVNEAFTGLTGYARGEAIGLNPRVLVRSGRHDQAFYRNLWDAILAGQVWASEMINRRKDGSLYTEEMTITPVRNSAGEIGHFIAIKQDVTERKRIEMALRESEERFRQIVENIREVFWVNAVATHEALYVSPAYDEIWGRSRERLRSNPLDWVEAIHPEDRSRVSDRFEEAVKGGEEFDVEYRILWPDGSIRFVHDRGIPVRDAAGQIYRIAGIATDITDRVAAQEQLRHLSTHDSLTGLFNRAFFEAELARFEREQHFPISIVIADLDDLKKVNDGEGHVAGDELLRSAAQALGGAFRSEDVLARIGGDEFAVLLPRTGEATARAALARLQSSLSKNNGRGPSLSLGVATAESRQSLLAALKLADERMYQDKTSRKQNRVS